jgi:hypothetical protein
MPVIVPFIGSIPQQQFTTVLDGVTYFIAVRWNARDAAWYFNISDVEQSLIRSGIKIALGALLGRRCVDPRFPPGVIQAFDMSGAGIDAGFDDLGTRVQVMYFTVAEWQALLQPAATS